MSSAPVLIFGSSGRVGGELTRQLVSAGVPVIAAVRDIGKAKRQLSSDSIPNSAKLQFIEADLTNPASVKNAASNSKAKRCFIYAVHGSPGMSETIEALKTAGISHVVLLSSWTIKPIYLAAQDAISLHHHQVEESIKKSGLSYTFLRAGYFASNTIQQWKHQIATGSIRLYKPESKWSMVTDEDMAAVAAVALTSNQLDNQAIPVTGEKLISQQEAVGIISKILKKPLTVVPVTEDEWKESAKAFAPPPILASIVRLQNDPDETKEGDLNAVHKVLGRPPMSFETFISKHKHEFDA